MEFLETGYPENTEAYLQTTQYFDFDHPLVAEFAEKAVHGANTDKEKAIKAFYAVGTGFDTTRIGSLMTRKRTPQAKSCEPGAHSAYRRHHYSPLSLEPREYRRQSVYLMSQITCVVSAFATPWAAKIYFSTTAMLSCLSRDSG